MSGPAPLLNVLLVSGGGFQGLAVLKGLLRAGHIRVVLADCYEENVGRYFAHRCLVVPPISQRDQFLEALLRICESENIHIIFPSTEFELTVLAEHAESFGARGIRVAVSSPDFLRRVCDKQQLQEFLRQEGLPAPAVVDLASSDLRFPLLGKPRSGWGSKGQLILNSLEELRRHSLDGLKERFVWQPLLRDFVEYSVDFAIRFDGAVSGLCLRERARVSGGFAVVAKLRENRHVSEIAERFARVAARRGGLGIFNLQIISAGGVHFISDVNPRMGTSAVFGYGVGLNLPAFVCLPEATANQGEPSASSRPVTMVRYLEEVFVEEAGLDGVRAVVFDLDDTLMNQKRWILDKLRGLYPGFKSKLPGPGEFLTRAMMILEEGNRSKLIDALCDHFALSAGLGRELIAAYREFQPREGPVFQDVRPLIEELKRRGYRLAILTNNPPDSQRQKIAACGFEQCFDAIVYALELQAEKPARAGFLEVADRLKLRPDEMVMVGDHLYSDIAGALDSGYRHGFLIQRPGGFYNFDVGIFEELRGRDRNVTVITGLRDTLRQLKAIR